MAQPEKAAVQRSDADPTAVEVAAAGSEAIVDDAELSEDLSQILPQALTIETPIVTAAGAPGPVGTGATQYSDDLGAVIDLLDSEEVIPSVEPSVDENALPEPGEVVGVEALTEVADGDAPPPDSAPPEAPAAESVTLSESTFGTFGLEGFETSGTLEGSETSGGLEGIGSTGLVLLGIDLDDGSLNSSFSADVFSGFDPGATLPFAGLPGFSAGEGTANTVHLSDLLPDASSVVSFMTPADLPGDAPPVVVTLPGAAGVTAGSIPVDVGPPADFPSVIPPPLPETFDVADAGMVDPNLPVF